MRRKSRQLTPKTSTQNKAVLEELKDKRAQGTGKKAKGRSKAFLISN